MNNYYEQDEQLYQAVYSLMGGNADSYYAMYDLSIKYIYKIIYDIVKDYHATEDLVQETYIIIYNKINTLENPRKFYSWAGRIATNLTYRYLQNNRRELLTLDSEDGNSEFIFDMAVQDNEEFIPENILMDKERQRLLAEIIDGLSVEQKLTVQYFYYEEMSVSEIAEAMGCTTGTVKSRLNYARKAIKAAVIDLAENQGTKLYSLSALPLFYILFRQAVAEFAFAGATAGVTGVVAGTAAGVTGVVAGTTVGATSVAAGMTTAGSMVSGAGTSGMNVGIGGGTTMGVNAGGMMYGTGGGTTVGTNVAMGETVVGVGTGGGTTVGTNLAVGGTIGGVPAGVGTETAVGGMATSTGAGTATGTATAVAASVSKGLLGKIGTSIGAKIVAGVVATSLVIGGGVAVHNFVTDKKDDTTAVTTEEVVEATDTDATEEGKLLKRRTTYLYSDGQEQMATATEYMYGEYGRECYYRYDYDLNGNVTSTRESKHCYDESGRIMKMEIYEDDTFLYDIDIECDENGNPIKYEYTDEGVEYVEEYEYHENGKDKSFKIYEDGQLVVDVEYDEFGNEISYKNYEDGVLESEENYEVKYEYDEDGKVIIAKSYLDSVLCSESQYDEDEDIVVEYGYHDDGTTMFKITYEYITDEATTDTDTLVEVVEELSVEDINRRLEAYYLNFLYSIYENNGKMVVQNDVGMLTYGFLNEWKTYEKMDYAIVDVDGDGYTELILREKPSVHIIKHNLIDENPQQIFFIRNPFDLEDMHYFDNGVIVHNSQNYFYLELFAKEDNEEFYSMDYEIYKKYDYTDLNMASEEEYEEFISTYDTDEDDIIWEIITHRDDQTIETSYADKAEIENFVGDYAEGATELNITFLPYMDLIEENAGDSTNAHSVDMNAKPIDPNTTDPTMLKYLELIRYICNNNAWPDGFAIEYTHDDVSANKYGVLDIDGDGRKELVIEITETATAGWHLRIYDYDSSTDELILQEFTGAFIDVYKNGVMFDTASHNHSLSCQTWPFELKVYNSDTDTYDSVAYSEGWDGEWMPDGFPSEYDKDGNKHIYMVGYIEQENEQISEEDTIYMDDAEYEEWLLQYVDTKELTVNYLAEPMSNVLD